jgi:hypothetical protein
MYQNKFLISLVAFENFGLLDTNSNVFLYAYLPPHKSAQRRGSWCHFEVSGQLHAPVSLLQMKETLPPYSLDRVKRKKVKVK